MLVPSKKWAPDQIRIKKVPRSSNRSKSERVGKYKSQITVHKYSAVGDEGRKLLTKSQKHRNVTQLQIRHDPAAGEEEFITGTAWKTEKTIEISNYL
jgi:hypothetical protein